jgi:hypothetical protein
MSIWKGIADKKLLSDFFKENNSETINDEPETYLLL